jgi:hypothetical protein
MLQSVLKNIGLTEKEVEVFMYCLKSKMIEPKKVIESTGIARTQVYTILNSLSKKWLISEIIGWQSKKFVVEDMSVLKKFIQSEREKLKLQMKLIDENKDVFEWLMQAEDETSYVKYYESEKGVKEIYDLALQDDYDCFSDLARVSKHFPGTFVGVWSLDNLKGVRCRNILTNNETAQWWKEQTSSLPNVETKVLPMGQEIKVDYILGNGYVAYISFMGWNINGILIKNRDIYESMKLQFDILWHKL